MIIDAENNQDEVTTIKDLILILIFFILMVENQFK